MTLAISMYRPVYSTVYGVVLTKQPSYSFPLKSVVGHSVLEAGSLYYIINMIGLPWQQTFITLYFILILAPLGLINCTADMRYLP